MTAYQLTEIEGEMSNNLEFIEFDSELISISVLELSYNSQFIKRPEIFCEESVETLPKR